MTFLRLLLAACPLKPTTAAERVYVCSRLKRLLTGVPDDEYAREDRELFLAEHPERRTVYDEARK